MSELSARPWEAQYPAGVTWQIDIPDKPAHSFLLDSAVEFGPKPALEFMGRQMTYSDLGAAVEKAEALTLVGIEPSEILVFDLA